MQAAEWWGPAKTSFLLHARGIEHHSKGVENVLAARADRVVLLVAGLPVVVKEQT